jgi:heat shock protein HslJ
MVKPLAMCAATLLMVACTPMTAPERPKAGALSDALPLVGTRWLLENMSGRRVVDGVQSTLEFVAADRVAGSGGCNRYAGPVVVSGNTLRFGPLVGTKMSCPASIMEQEDRFLAALRTSTTYRIDEPGKLVLSDESATVQLQFSRLDVRSQDTRPEGGGTETALER